MKSVAIPPDAPNRERPQAPPTQYEVLVDERLRQTRRQIKGVDIAAGLLTLGAVSLGYLLVATLADHWLIPRGLGVTGRILLLVGLVGLIGFYLWRNVLPLVVYRINPLFAAQTIEEVRPSLKNSLVNLLFLRRERGGIEQGQLARQVLRGLERRAASELREVPVEGTVDHRRVIWWGYVLVAVLVICALYLLLSPKSLFASFGRVVLPWANIQAPTRVTFDSITPGDHAAYQGDTVKVTAVVRGLREDEEVLLYYTTADGQSVDQAIPMTVTEGGYRHRCELPPGQEGLRQEVAYYLSAGDCRSAEFRIEVGVAPAIVVESVHYDYLDYTGLADRTDRQTGDIQAVEGTRVTIGAVANLPIDHAVMEMNADPRQTLTMKSEGDRATRELALRMSRDDPSRPQYESYQIRFTDTSRRENRRPTRHRIRVIPDRAPQIALVDPPPDRVELPADAALDLRVRAKDPDFALRRVDLRAERKGELLKISPLLKKSRPDPGHEGPFESSYRFVPNKLGLEGGDEVIYWAEAEDNKESPEGPEPNRAMTQRRWILITAPESAVPREAPPRDKTQEQDQTSRNENKDQQNRETPDQQDQDNTQSEQEEPRSEDGTPQDQEQRNGESDRSQEQQNQSEDQQSSEQQQPGEQGGASDSADQGAGTESDSSEASSEESQQGGNESGKGEPGKEMGSEPSEAEGVGDGTSQEPTGEPSSQDGQSAEQGSQRKPSSDQSSTSQPGQPDQPVNPETDPGEAIERILQHREEQEADGNQPSGQESQSPQPSDGSQSGDAQGSQSEGSETQREPESMAGGSDQKPPKQGSSSGTQNSQKTQQEKPEPGSAEAGQEQSSEESQGQEQPGGKEPESPGEPSAQSKKDGTEGKPEGEQQDKGGGSEARKPEESSPKQPCDNPDCKDGSCDECQGKSGAGQSSGQNAGSPKPQEANKPGEKQQGGGQPNQQKPGNEQSAQSPSTSPRQSDSESDTEGDRSGGGEEGGGQKADRPGQGTPGTNAPAEEGGQTSNQQGEGETGQEAGDQVAADRPTGQPASQGEGPGSESRSEPGGEGAKDKPQEQQQQGTPEANNPTEPGQQGASPPPGAQPKRSPASGQSPPVTGGAPGEKPAVQPPTPQPPRGPDGDPENLEYAREQTDLALDHLQDQLAEQDPDLLDQLGWTREDAQKFLQKWQKMKEAAGVEGDVGQAKRQLDETIRGLGLRPKGTRLGNDFVERHLRSVRDSRRFEPPPEWAELVDEYNKSISSDLPSSD